MVDASHNLKDPIEDLIQSTDQIQVTLAQALLVDRDQLREAQDDDDPARAAEVLQAAYRTDVRPLVAEARRAQRRRPRPHRRLPPARVPRRGHRRARHRRGRHRPVTRPNRS